MLNVDSFRSIEHDHHMRAFGRDFECIPLAARLRDRRHLVDIDDRSGAERERFHVLPEPVRRGRVVGELRCQHGGAGAERERLHVLPEQVRGWVRVAK